MKALCPECRDKVSVDTELFDSGDEFTCPKCDADLVVSRKGEKVKLKSPAEGFEEFERETHGVEAGGLEENFMDGSDAE